MPHDLLQKLRFGSLLDYLAFLVYCVETGSDMNEYEAYTKKVDMERRAIEREMKKQEREERNESNCSRESFTAEEKSFIAVENLNLSENVELYSKKLSFEKRFALK